VSGKVIIGVDPGKSGGLAAIHPDGSVKHFGFETTDMHEAVLAVVQDPKWIYPLVAYVEEVGGYVGMRQPGSAMFTFGHAAGRITGILEALGIPIRLVRPQAWQKGISGVAVARKGAKAAALSAGAEVDDASRKAKSAGKKELCNEARRRFPSVKVTQQNADALLIADYGVQAERGVVVKCQPPM